MEATINDESHNEGNQHGNLKHDADLVECPVLFSSADTAANENEYESLARGEKNAAAVQSFVPISSTLHPWVLSDSLSEF